MNERMLSRWSIYKPEDERREVFNDHQYSPVHIYCISLTRHAAVRDVFGHVLLMLTQLASIRRFVEETRKKPEASAPSFSSPGHEKGTREYGSLVGSLPSQVSD